MNALDPLSLGSPTHSPAMAEPSPAGAAASGPVLLAARGLRKAFGGQVVLDGVDLELRQGEVVLLRGENGSGKTTLLNILTGNLEPDAGTIEYRADSTPRTYTFPRRWWQELNPFDHFTPEFVAREGIGRTWQDVRLFGAQSLRDNIIVADADQPGENPLVALLAPGRTARQESELATRAEAALSRLGLAGREDSSADKISLGQSKRVAIARAVEGNARILFLDEPLAGLDRRGVQEILALLRMLLAERSLTLVIVEHVFNHVHLGGLVTTEWDLQAGRIARSSRGVARASAADAAAGRPSWIATLAAGAAEVREESLPGGASLTRIRRPGPRDPSADRFFEARQLAVRRGPRIVFDWGEPGLCTGLDLELNHGEIAVLQAPNGWGKTTLADAITGVAPEAVGDLRLSGERLMGLAPWRRTTLGVTALAAAPRLFPTLTVGELARLGGVPWGRESVGHDPWRPIHALSGGQKQLLALGTVLARATPDRLLLLDEPLSGLDNEAAEWAASAIARCKAGATLILIPSRRENDLEAA